METAHAALKRLISESCVVSDRCHLDFLRFGRVRFCLVNVVKSEQAQDFRRLQAPDMRQPFGF